MTSENKAKKQNKVRPFTGPEADKLRTYARRHSVSEYHINSIFRHEMDPHGEINRLIDLMQTPRGDTKYAMKPSELEADEEQLFSQMIAGNAEPRTIV